MSTRILAQPTSEPLQLDDVKEYLKVDEPDDDALIQRLITQVRRQAEQITRMALAVATYESIVDLDMPVQGILSGFIGYGSGKIEIPFSPLITVTDVSIEQTPGTWISIDPSNYAIDYNSLPGALWVTAQGLSLIGQVVWAFWNGPFEPRLKVTYQAGYSDPTQVPAEIVLAMYEIIASQYEDRSGDAATMPIGAISKLEDARIQLL